ncbi:MAG: mevalonate kinase [Candidatus Hodarchaeota archaeon]
MIDEIKNFVSKLKPNIFVQAPSRINLINPLDAVEGDYWMPSVAINGIEDPLSAFVYIKGIEKKSVIRFYNVNVKGKKPSITLDLKADLTKNKLLLKDDYDDKIKLIYSSIYRFSIYSSYFWNKFLEQNIEIGVITTIPRQSGLGGSASIIIALLYGLAEYFEIYNDLSHLKPGEIPINKDIIAEMATEVEDKDMKVSAGYSDRYVISRGGLCFCSYIGKLFHKKISEEPLAVYDKINETYNINDLPIIICYSGAIHESGTVHGKLRARYLHKEPQILKDYERLAEIAWKSRFAIMKKDWLLLGYYFKQNTEIMNKVMKDTGFTYGIGLVNNLLIKLIQDHPDVYAVKLTGAGGGGSVFALVNPDKLDNILIEWKTRLNNLITDKERLALLPFGVEESLRNAKFYKIKIDLTGVKKL